MLTYRLDTGSRNRKLDHEMPISAASLTNKNDERNSDSNGVNVNKDENDCFYTSDTSTANNSK